MKPSEIAKLAIESPDFHEEDLVVHRAYLRLRELAAAVDNDAQPINGSREWVVGANTLGPLQEALEENDDV